MIRLLSLLTIGIALMAAEADRTMSGPTLSNAYQPLVIVGEGWSQQFIIQNVGQVRGTNLKATLKFFDREGKPWPIDIVGKGRVSSILLDIPVVGSMTFETVVYWFEQQLGWAMIELPKEIDDRNFFHAHTVFRKQAPGRADLMTSTMMTDTSISRSVVYFDNTGGNITGVAILNVDFDESVTLVFYSENGQPLSSLNAAIRSMKKGEMWWFDLATEFPATANRRGSLLIRGWSPQSFSLQFTPSGAFTAISTTSAL